MKLYLLIGNGILSILIYILLTKESFKSPTVSYFILLFSIVYLIFCVSIFLSLHISILKENVSITVILIFALLFRFISLFGLPLFEDDIHRYLWDAKVWSNGINPYFYPPNDFFLEHLKDENWKHINFKNIPTIYPPFSQFIFRLSHAILPNSIIILKSVLLFFDLGLITLIIWLLKTLKLRLSRIIFYAWNPLIIKEFSNSGHIDVVAIFFVFLVIVFSIKKFKIFSAIFLGLSILTKLFPLVLIPCLIRQFRIKHYIICIAIVLFCYIPFSNARELLFEGLITYSKYWEFNSSGFAVIHFLLNLIFDFPILIAKGLIIISLGGLGLYLAKNIAKDPFLRIKGFFIIIGGLLIFSPTVNTWYITWIVPFLCIFPRISWLLLTGTSVITYCYFWQDRDFWWIRAIEYLPFYIFLIIENVSKIKNILNKILHLLIFTKNLLKNSFT